MIGFFDVVFDKNMDPKELFVEHKPEPAKTAAMPPKQPSSTL